VSGVSKRSYSQGDTQRERERERAESAARVTTFFFLNGRYNGRICEAAAIGAMFL
jgi:hypothetical protein